MMNTVAGRLVFLALLIHAVLLPLLMNAILYVVRESNADTFVSHARIYARSIADMIVSSGALNDDGRLLELLDSAMLSSDGAYAEVRDGGRSIASTLAAPERASAFVEDFAFGEHGDGVYYLSIPLQVPGHSAVLRLGLDEQATAVAISLARRTLLEILATYLLVSLFLLLLLGLYLTRPLHTLRRASRKIASGQYSEHLEVDSRIREFSQLATDLERMRSALVGVNRQLENEIHERKVAEEQSEFLEVQLRQAQKLETVGTLAGGIAHEFNNILVPITLYAEAALDDVGTEGPAGQHIARVLRAANRAKSLVQQILDFSHQARHEDRRVVRIGPVVEEAIRLMRALLPASVEIQTDIDVDAGSVLADPAQIHQIVMNLCNNAYQALYEQGGCLRVAVSRSQVNVQLARRHPDLEEGPHVVVSVSDNGRGMDPLTLERIFEPFFTTRPVGEGTGLGLSVAHGITRAHGGSILVTSELGAGSRFDVYLPTYRGSAPASAERRARVLCLCGDAARRAVHVPALQALGYEVRAPIDAAAQSAAMREAPTSADVLVVDPEALARMEALQQTLGRQPPAILLCALGDMINGARQDKHAVSLVLIEPIVPEALAANIRELMEREPAHG